MTRHSTRRRLVNLSISRCRDLGDANIISDRTVTISKYSLNNNLTTAAGIMIWRSVYVFCALISLELTSSFHRRVTPSTTFPTVVRSNRVVGSSSSIRSSISIADSDGGSISSSSGSSSGSSGIETKVIPSNGIIFTEPHPIYPAVSSRNKKDAWWEKILIFFLSWGLAAISPNRDLAFKNVWPGMGFEQFVKVTRTLLKGTTEEIKMKIVGVLLIVLPLKMRVKVRAISAKRPKWISEMSSKFISFGLLGWLVGPIERFHVDVTVPVVDATTGEPTGETTTEKWLSGVKLLECRYLVESGCKSACLNLCRGPTQAVLNDELGMKMYMKPNFKDCSCELMFGVSPPPVSEDDAYGQACFSTCSMSAEVAEQRQRERLMTLEAKELLSKDGSKFTRCT